MPNIRTVKFNNLILNSSLFLNLEIMNETIAAMIKEKTKIFNEDNK